MLKTAALSLPCLVIVAIGVVGLLEGESMLGSDPTTHWAAIAIAGATAAILLRVGFEKRPVLVIDENGIACRRPDIGTIPWRAVVSVGTAQTLLRHKVMTIAVDEAELEDEARRHLENQLGLSGAFSRDMTRFERRASGYPSIQVTISSLSMSMPEFEARLAALANAYGPRS